MDNVVDLSDHALFLGEQATGATSLIQCVWIYDRAVDLDGLGRFHGQLRRGRLSRRIERSPLPFGRLRWVAGHGGELEVSPPRPAGELEAWLHEQANTALDCVSGPGWHLALLPLTSGGAAVSLVISHTLTDGVGLCLALADAVVGREDATAWPAAGSRGRWRAVRQDVRRAVHDLPSVGRALRAAATMNRPARDGAAAVATVRPDERIVLPAATAFVDIADWDARAQELGGSPNALLAGVAAELARRLGRTTPDGTAVLSIPVNDRVDGDTRANAVSDIEVRVAPATDLRPIRAAIKAALAGRETAPDERRALLPLTPFLPKWLVRRMIRIAAGTSVTVVSSNVGDLDPAVNRPDGTDAAAFTMRSLYPGVTRATMDGVGGVLALLSGRVGGRVFVSTLGYLPDHDLSDAVLREAVSATLARFGRSASIGLPEGTRHVHA